MSDQALGSLGGGIVGAAAGFALAGPAGVAAGYSVGSAAGSALVGGPTRERSAPRPPEELQRQTTKYGEPLPKTYGSNRVAGNFIWLKNNKRDIVENTTESGSKGGGPSVETTTFQVFATFAISIADGEISGVRRIWFASDLVFDGSDTASAEQLQSGLNSNQWTLYHGTNNQDVDPDIEADIGTGNTPAFINTAYIVFRDIDLGPYGDAIPPITVEVTPATSGSIPRLLHEVELPPTGTNFTVANSDLILYDQGVIRLNLSDSGKTWTTGDKSNAFDWVFDQNGNFIFKEPNPFQAFFGDRNSHVGKLLTPFGEPIWIAFGRDASGENYRLSAFRIFPLTGETQEFQVIQSGSTGKPEDFPIGACVSSNQQELYLFDHDTPDPTYRVLNTSLEEIKRGTVTGFDFDITIAGAAITGNRPPFVNEEGSLLWIKNSDSDAQSLGVYELNSDGDYDFIGEVSLAGSGETGVARGTNLYLFDDSGGNGNGVARAYTVQPGLSQNTEPLPDVIEDITGRSGVPAANVDTSALAGINVRGYTTDIGDAASILGPLRQAFFFDIVEVGYVIKFIPRGQGSVATLTDGDLSARAPGQEQPPIIEETQQQPETVPQRVFIKAPDPGRNYESNAQYAERTTTLSEQEKRIETTVVLTADEQARMADVLLREALYGQSQLAATATIQTAALIPGDVVTLETSNFTGDARITKVDDGRPGLRKLELTPELAEIYSSTAVGSLGSPSDQVLSPSGPTRFEILDLPPLRSADNDPGLYIAMDRALGGWPGAVFQRRSAGEWQTLRSGTNATPIGSTTDTLPAPTTTAVWDYGSTVNVRMPTGQLSSATKDDVLQGANAIAIQASDSWELVQYVNATLESDGTYTLDTLLRGRNGTERLVDQHAAGDRVVVLRRNALRRVQLEADEIGTSDPYRAVTIGQSSGSSEQYKYRGIGLKPFAPSKLRGVRQGNNDIDLSCFRRVRYAGGWRDSQDVPQVEDELKFEWDVLDGNGDVVRTLTSNDSTVTYTEAEQVNDFGSVQSSYDVTVYQISGDVGRGFPTTATVPNRG